MRFTVMVLMVALSGCASTSLVPDEDAVSKLSESNGILFGTFATDTEKFKYPAQSFSFISNETSEKYILHATFNLFPNTPTDFVLTTVTQREIEKAMDKLNHRPGKLLGFRTLFEVFFNTRTSLTVVIQS